MQGDAQMSFPTSLWAKSDLGGYIGSCIDDDMAQDFIDVPYNEKSILTAT